jgi:hypothetical protein
MEIERLNRLCHKGFCGFGWISRRAMTMGYVYFVIFIAACGLVIIGYGTFLGYLNNGERLSFFRQANNTPPNEPAPPLKKTVGGISDLEIQRNDLMSKVDIWQREHEQRRSTFNEAEYSLSGTKYQYEPSGRNRTAAVNTS